MLRTAVVAACVAAIVSLSVAAYNFNAAYVAWQDQRAEFDTTAYSPEMCSAIARIYGDVAAFESAYPPDAGKPPIANQFLPHLQGCPADLVASGVAQSLAADAGITIKARQ